MVNLMAVIISFLVGGAVGIVAMAFSVVCGNLEREEEAYRLGYEDGLKAGRKSEKQERL